MSGTVRALVANMVTGVSKGLRTQAEPWWAWVTAPQVQGDAVKLQLGFSHDVDAQAARRRISADARLQTEIVLKRLQSEGKSSVR